MLLLLARRDGVKIAKVRIVLVVTARARPVAVDGPLVVELAVLVVDGRRDLPLFCGRWLFGLLGGGRRRELVVVVLLVIVPVPHTIKLIRLRLTLRAMRDFPVRDRAGKQRQAHHRQRDQGRGRQPRPPTLPTPTPRHDGKRPHHTRAHRHDNTRNTRNTHNSSHTRLPQTPLPPSLPRDRPHRPRDRPTLGCPPSEGGREEGRDRGREEGRKESISEWSPPHSTPTHHSFTVRSHPHRTPFTRTRRTKTTHGGRDRRTSQPIV